MNNFRLLIIFITGFCSLGYQVVWQRYLAVLVGSQARSLTIIVAVFLLGLTLGYYFFGQLAIKVKERRHLLKIYGFVELATGAYAVIFPKIFEFFFNSSISHTNNFWIHILLATLLLFPATILMGATVPIMTTVLPESDENIDLTHSRVYGVNTLGAFLGTVLVGFWLLPQFGYELCLSLLGMINVLASLFYIKNNLIGNSYQKEDINCIESDYDQSSLYFLGFIAGLVSLSLEILWFRVLSLTMGSSFIVFPFILSIFILMIGLGSLTIKEISLRNFKKTLVFSLIFSFISFLAIPYLPLFISNIRAMFISHKVTFYVFHTVSYLVVLSLLAPAVFYLGRILPFVYAFIPKTKQNYGLKCGYLYFFNTLGTFLGSILLGYLAFHFFDLKTIYLIALSSLFLPGIYFLRRNSRLLIILIVLGVSSLTLPFPRKYHAQGLFRQKKLGREHFKNIVSETNKAYKGLIYLSDGPNTTVSVFKNKKDNSKSIFVNGKSDGSTIGDYGTITLLALLPYLATSQKQMNASVIGIGTGVTAGLLTNLERISHLDVVEISDAIIDSIEYMAPENFNFHQNPKTELHHGDAFQFFKTTRRKYDIVISEPSNPWVMGVEDLFTNYFYETVKSRLDSKGLFVQWMHTYSMSKEVLMSVLNNLKGSFRNVATYNLYPGDIVFIASNRVENLTIEKQSVEDKAKLVLNNLGITRAEDLNFFKIHNSQTVNALVQINSFLSHEIFHPQLSRRAYFDFFLDYHTFHINNLMDPFLRRILRENRSHRFKRLKEIIKKTDCRKKVDYVNLFCVDIIPRYKLVLKNIKSNSLGKKLKAYSVLRDDGFIKKDIELIKNAFEKLSRQKNNSRTDKLFQKVIEELLKEQEFALAKSFIEVFERLKLIAEKRKQGFFLMIEKARQNYEKLSRLH